MKKSLNLFISRDQRLKCSTLPIKLFLFVFYIPNLFCSSPHIQSNKETDAAYETSLSFAILEAYAIYNPPSSWSLQDRLYLEKIKYKLDQTRHFLLKKGEEELRAGLYENAVKTFEKILRDFSFRHPLLPIEEEDFHIELIFQLAFSHFLCDNFPSALTLLRESKFQNLSKSHQNFQILLAIVQNSMGLYQETIQLLQNYLNTPKDQLSYCNEAYIELAAAYFLSGNLSLASHYLNLINPSNSASWLVTISKFYLTRINIAEGNYLEAEKILSQLIDQIPTNEMTFYEFLYLKGEVAFHLGKYLEAAVFFEKAIPKVSPLEIPWKIEALSYLGWSYLNMADDSSENLSNRKVYFEHAEKAFLDLLKIRSDEQIYLALSQCYLTRATSLKEESYFQKAEELLSKKENFTSRETQSQALLLKAQAGNNYLNRERYYRQLTQTSNQNLNSYGKGWYLRGLNDFQEADSLISLGCQEEAFQLYERAIFSLNKAFELLKDIEPEQASLALNYYVQAQNQLPSLENKLKAFSLLDSLLHENLFLKSLTNPDEIYYFHGLLALHIFQFTNDPKIEALAIHSLRKSLSSFPKGNFSDAILNLLGIIYFKKGNYREAEKIFLQLIEKYPHSKLMGETFFWAAQCASQNGDEEKAKYYRRQVFEKYPECSHAAEAYFSLHFPIDYLQGNKAAIKHLQAFKRYFPQSPLLLNAFFLIGLDYKRDRRTSEGKWIRKKDLNASIDAFHEVEDIFDKFILEDRIPISELDSYVNLRYRATLERALANLAIAEESQGAKKQIYLEYAEEVFRQIFDAFEQPQNNYIKILINKEPIPQIQEESCYWLAQVCIKNQNDEEAEKILASMLEKYRSAKISKGYYLSQNWYEQGLISMRQREFSVALQCFLKAEDAAKGNILNTDQKLELWIQQSFAYKALNQLDQAILILSKAINDDAISGLRLKAMFLRAEAYEMQGRFELARKQLEATSKKGGEWAIQAKLKLEKEYGYQ